MGSFDRAIDPLPAPSDQAQTPLLRRVAPVHAPAVVVVVGAVKVTVCAGVVVVGPGVVLDVNGDAPTVAPCDIYTRHHLLVSTPICV